MSPTKPLSPCLVRGCPARAVSFGRCSDHAKEKQRAIQSLAPTSRPSSSARGYDRDWQKLRAERLKGQACSIPTCSAVANHLHHDPDYPTLGRDHRRYQLIPLCGQHHSQLTARRHPFADQSVNGPRGYFPNPQFAARERDLSRRPSSFVVSIVGAPATGKSYLRAALDQHLGLPTDSIDEERLRLLGNNENWPSDDLAAWVALENFTDAYSPCVVETSGLHSNDFVLFEDRSIFRVMCTAPDSIRKQRLEQRLTDGYRLARGESDYVEKLLLLPSPRLKADVTWDSTRLPSTVETIAMTVEEWLRQR